jgi:Asp-tRNA(Asn)/Glu-tRNA(Gln) amidotransferase A subunit family amidase
MIVVRDIFRLKFGQSKEAMALWKEAASALRNSGYGAIDVRLLTDLAGTPYYTVILESTYHSAAEWEKAHQAARDNATWKALYAKIIPFTESGQREILSVVA